MKHVWLILLVAVFVVTTALSAQGAYWAGLAVAGGNGTTSASAFGNGIAYGWLGNQIIAGSMNNFFQYGSATLTSYGGTDVFVASLDDQGNWLWAIHAGGSGTDRALAVTTDVLGYAYVTGSFSGTATFGSFSLTSYGGTDAFFAKVSPEGQWLWALQAGGTGDDAGTAIHKSLNGSIWTAGTYTGSITLGPYSLEPFGQTDLFAAKLHMNGYFTAVARAGTPYTDHSPSITSDNSDNAWLAGRFSNTITFPRLPVAPDITLTSSGSTDVFVARLSPQGAWQWGTRGGGNSLDAAFGIATNGSGSVWITGTFAGLATFGGTSLTSIGTAQMEDVLVAKLYSDGSWAWAKRGGSTSWDEGLDISVDPMGNSYVTGTYRGTANFGDHNLSFLPNGADSHAFAVRLDFFGNYVWALASGGNWYETGLGICIDQATGSLWVSGAFSENISLGSFSANIPYSTNCFAGRIANGAQVPAPPQNLHLQLYVDDPGLPAGYTYILTWDPVTLDTGGYPLHPTVIYYSVWACFETTPYGDYQFLADTPNTYYQGWWPQGDEMPHFFWVKTMISEDPR